VVYDHGVAASTSLDRTATLVAVAVFIALMVDGMDLQMLSLSLTSISKEFHLSTIAAGALSTWTLVGMGLGGALAGWLSDRVGRARVVLYSVLIFSAFTGIIAATTTFWQIAMMRLVSGFGLGSVYSVGTLLAAEYVPMEKRTTVLGTLQAGWSAGYVAAALLSSWLLPTHGWRILFAAAILPGIVAVILLSKVPDPPSWIENRRNQQRARIKPTPFRAIWADPVIRRLFILWSLASIALQFGYYGATTWLPSYLVRDLGVNLQNAGWYVAGTYAMMFVGKVVTGYLADLAGRRTMWIVVGTVTAVYVPLLIAIATPANVAYLLLLFGFFYGAPYAISATYMSESFPGTIRGTAVGTSYNIGRIGSTLSPILIGIAASRYSIGLGLGLLGISYAICALIPGAFIPEKLYNPNEVEPLPSRVPETAATVSRSAISI
jgi:AAHS family cis,cis-muconate transporter-like MFS transporter